MDPDSLPILLAWLVAYGYLALFLILFVEELGVPLPLPGDLALLFAGYLVGRGILRFDVTLLVALAAVLGGASALYALTRRYGHPLLARYGRRIHLDEGRLRRFEATSRRFGPAGVFVVRLVPGMRIYTAALAGLTGVPFTRFFLALTPAALVWAAAFVAIGYRVGEGWDELYTLLEHHAVLGATTAAILLVLAAGAWRWRTSWTGRASRLLRKRSGVHQESLRLPR
jgi:membrane protein DedA with SNARE-associated domain